MTPTVSMCSFFFFLMSRPPPRSPLFPYPPLFRSRVVPAVAPRVAAEHAPDGQHGAAQYAEALDRLHRVRRAARVVAARSEEHTSELQSRQYLVCRLLLEKKNNVCGSSSC